MKLKQIAIACAAALAVPMVAHAAAPTGPYDTTGAITVYMSGASAPDSFIDTIMVGMLKPGFYKYTSGTDYRLYLGELAASNQKIVFIKRSKGGSAFGVNPIGETDPAKTKLQTLALNPTDCPTAAVAGGAVGTCNPVGFDPGFGVPNGKEMAPDFGASDVAPFMFKEPYNVEFGASQLNDTSAMIIRGVNTAMMGIVTTAAVPDTLQISNADVQAMLTGNVVDWNTIGAGIDTATDTKTNVVVCRRWPGSGTQSSYNWYFNNFPCSVNSLTSGVSGATVPSRMSDSYGYAGANGKGTQDGSKAANAIGIDVTQGFTVLENSGSGDVRACLKAANNKAEYNFKSEDGKFYTANFNTAPAGDTANKGYRAIGVLSLDSQGKTSTSADDGGAESAWFFRALNGTGRFYANGQKCLVGATLPAPGAAPVGGTTAAGVCPNYTELRSGHYDFAGELTMQYPSSMTSSPKFPFINEFITRAGDPVFQQPWVMALPGGAYVPNGSNAVSFASRQGNQCGPLVRGTY